jgi:hypothetical protein
VNFHGVTHIEWRDFGFELLGLDFG